MKILIAVPTYNRVRCLAQLIALFRVQKTTHEVDILIVNDGDYLLTSSDPRIIVENLPERRSTGDKRYFAYRYAVEHCYDFIMDVDDDDYYYPDYVEAMVNAITASGVPYGCLHYGHWMMRNGYNAVSALIGYPFNATHAQTITDLRTCGDNHFYHPMDMEYPLPEGSLNYRCDCFKKHSYVNSLKPDGHGTLYVFTLGLRAIPDPGTPWLDIAAMAVPLITEIYKPRNRLAPFEDQRARSTINI